MLKYFSDTKKAITFTTPQHPRTLLTQINAKKLAHIYEGGAYMAASYTKNTKPKSSIVYLKPRLNTYGNKMHCLL